MKRYPSCIMSTCCVPWDEQDQVIESVFRRSIRSALQGTSHLYVFGTAGEGYAVTDQQFEQIVAIFVDEMRAGGAEPMVGIIHLSLGSIVQRIRRARDLGVRRFQVSLPSWGALNERELFRFFDAVCGAFPECEFLHYNLARTKRLVTAQEYRRLAAQHPNLVATKNSNDSLSGTAQLLEEAPELQHFLNEIGYLYGSLLGECSLLASFVTNWPRLQRLFEAGKSRDLATSALLQRELRVYMQQLELLGGSVHIDGAYDKLFARIIDPEFPLRLLPPYSYASEQQFNEVLSALRERVPQWLPDAS